MIDVLYSIIDSEKIKYRERDLRSIELKGLYFDNIIYIDNDNIDTEAEKRCIIAEEIGHHYTTTENILDQKKLHKQKQEEKARRWAVDQLIKPPDFIRAYEAGVRNRAELSEFLDVTEEFIDLSVKHFEKVHGTHLTLDQYTIFFNPLWVYKEL